MRLISSGFLPMAEMQKQKAEMKGATTPAAGQSLMAAEQIVAHTAEHRTFNDWVAA